MSDLSIENYQIISLTYNGLSSPLLLSPAEGCLHIYNLNFLFFQWTVNGCLRIGFFTKKQITAETELTFDYQFETYG
jgi:hypothetical protein